MNRCCLCKRPPEAWIAPREIREITRYGHKLVSQVHAVLAKLGTPVTRELLILVFTGCATIRSAAWPGSRLTPARFQG